MPMQAARVPESVEARLAEDVTVLNDALGACERILKQPIPLTVTRCTARGIQGNLREFKGILKCH